MTGELGRWLLIGGLVVSGLSTLACGLAASGRTLWLRVARLGLALTGVLIVLAAGVLAWAMANVDLRLAYVEQHTELSLPVPLRIAALWSGQEGSLLVWTSMIAVIAAAAGIARRRMTAPGEWATLGVLAGVNTFFAAMLVFAAEPFKMVADPSPDGLGLHPQLQHWAMIVHPPLLLAGYAGFVVPFAIVCGAMAAGRRDDGWVGPMRRWAAGAWTCLGAGIALGAWWAYVELGWGGYWAWDPVENASLMPWLCGTALLHTIGVHQRRGQLKPWTVGLGVGTFAMCVFGAYLTRSGVVQSVHAFTASSVGRLLLGLLGAVSLAGAAIFLFRRACMADSSPSEGALRPTIGISSVRLANTLLVTMAATTLIGTVFPLFSAAVMTTPVSVGPAYFNRVVAPMGLAVIGLMAIAPVLSIAGAGALRRRLAAPSIVTALALGAAIGGDMRRPLFLFCAGLAAFVVASIVNDVVSSVRTHARHTGFGLARSAAMVFDAGRRRVGSQMAHCGIALLMVGVAGSSLLSERHTVMLTPGESASIGNQALRLETINEVRGETYTAAESQLRMGRAGEAGVLMTPQRRYYDKFAEASTEVAIRSNWRRDVYVAMVGWNGRDQRAALDVHVNPLAMWVWIGAGMVTLGGAISLLPRLLPRPRAEQSPWDDGRALVDPAQTVPLSVRESKS